MGMPRIRSVGSMQQLAPLELGAKMERAAVLNARIWHVLGRAVLLALIYLGAPHAAGPHCCHVSV